MMEEFGSGHNQRVIASCNELWEQYMLGKARVPWVDEWLRQAVEGLACSSRLFEFGGGTGDDARFLQLQGYQVEVSEAAPALVDYMNGQGLAARQFNALVDDFPEGCDLIFSAAVLQHFTPQEFETVITRIFEALPAGGRFAFQLLEGEGEEVMEEGDFYSYLHFWPRERLAQVLERAGFRRAAIAHTREQVGREEEYLDWLSVIAEKPNDEQ